jgi:ABC-type transport system involved in multi-copper enzyme maturation permease subunit
MRTLSRELWAVARLDLAEALRSRWVLFSGLAYALLGGAFVFVGMRESSVLGFSGMGRALLSMIHALLLLLPLFALTATGQVINRAREDGTLELLFSHPVRRSVYFLAISITRYLVLALPLVVLMLVMTLIGRWVFGQETGWGFVFQAMGISASLIACFVGAGIAVSTFIRNQARAVIWILVIWAAAVAFMDFGLVAVMLNWRVTPEVVFILAALNPVQAARMALLAGTSSELSVLGPVGFYLMHQVGSAWLLVLGLLWPLVCGAAWWCAALLSFRRADIV